MLINRRIDFCIISQGAFWLSITFIDDIKFAIKNDKDLAPEADKIIDDLFYNNAKKLYSKKINITNPKSNKIVKYFISTASIIGLMVFLGMLIQKNKKYETTNTR